MNDVLRMLNERGLTAEQLQADPGYLAEIIKLVDANTVNTNTGKALLTKVQTAGAPRARSCRPKGWPRSATIRHPRRGAGPAGESPKEVQAYQAAR
jgi:hypothetical protein